MNKCLKNILIIKPSSLGDIVLALPVLSALRRNFPDARISWLVRTEFAPLLENHPHLNDIILFDRKFLGKAWYNPEAMARLMALIRLLRRSTFDAVIDLQGLFRTASLGWLSGCKKRFGIASAREFAHLFYTHKVTQDRQCIHLVDYYLKIVKAAGASDLAVEFVLPNNPAACDSVGRLLADNGIDPDNYAVLVPSSAHPDKCWPVERFAALADKISSQFGLAIVAVAAAAEKGLTQKLKTIANVPVANFAGLTNLNELIPLLKSAKIVISNDTGPAHIAAALARPLVIIFGRSNPARVAPYRRSECVVAIDPYGRGFAADSADPKCDIKAVAFDDVYKALCRQMVQQTPQSNDD